MRAQAGRAVLLAVLAAGAVAGGAAPAGAAETEVPISGYSFPADPVTVAVGDTVKWTNNDNDSHTVTADDGSFDSGSLAPRGTFTHTFAQAGTFSYHCSIHTSMVATVQVGAAAATTAPTAPTTTTAPKATTADAAEDDGGSDLLVPGVAALVLLAAGAGWWALRRRSATPVRR